MKKSKKNETKITTTEDKVKVLKCPVVEKVNFDLKNGTPKTIHILEEFEDLLNAMSSKSKSTEKVS